MYYIVAGYTGSIDHVWAHHGVNHGERGCWARDIDAEYRNTTFGFKRKATALKRAEHIVNTGEGCPTTPFVYVVDRPRLFELLDLDDWAYGKSARKRP